MLKLYIDFALIVNSKNADKKEEELFLSIYIWKNNTLKYAYLEFILCKVNEISYSRIILFQLMLIKNL